MISVRRLLQLLVAPLMVVIGGCTLITGRTWVSTYSGSPLIFSVPADSSGAVWARARSWFGGFNTPRLATDSDTLLQSAETRTGKGTYVLGVTRNDSAGAVFFTVHVTPSDPKDKEITRRAGDRAEELAYVARTGDNQQAYIQRGAE